MQKWPHAKIMGVGVLRGASRQAGLICDGTFNVELDKHGYWHPSTGVHRLSRTRRACKRLLCLQSFQQICHTQVWSNSPTEHAQSYDVKRKFDASWGAWSGASNMWLPAPESGDCSLTNKGKAHARGLCLSSPEPTCRGQICLILLIRAGSGPLSTMSLKLLPKYEAPAMLAMRMVQSARFSMRT